MFDDGKSVENPPYDSVQLGTVVSIEASHPLKGLKQAAIMKRLIGDGRPAEMWGKLIKVSSISEYQILWLERPYIQDLELWDPAGDMLVYFSYQRSQASFRVKLSVLEDVKSGYLLSKLQQGQRTAKVLSSRPHQHLFVAWPQEPSAWQWFHSISVFISRDWHFCQ